MDKNMEVAEEQVHISVRNLVEFILRSGDIDNRVAGTDKDAMLLGGKMHRKIPFTSSTKIVPEPALLKLAWLATTWLTAILPEPA